MSDWRPIETAPKDGINILLWDGKVIYLAYWNPEFDSHWDEVEDKSVPIGQWTDDTVASFAYEKTQYIEHPTHWMPLPEQPK